MARNWTFGEKVGGGFALTVALAVGMGAVAVYALRSVVETKDRVIDVNAHLLIDAEKLNETIERRSAHLRGYLLTREDGNLDRIHLADADYATVLARLQQNAYTADGREILESIKVLGQDYLTARDKIVAMRRTDASLDVVVAAFEQQVLPIRDRFDQEIGTFVTRQERLLKDAKDASSDSASRAILLVVIIAAAVVLFAGLVAFILTSSLGRQIGGAVGQVQSSSAELQAAANQQATGARQQATAMSEITTTISELLATARQIAESAQRVAQIAGQTSTSARSGDQTVDRANEHVVAIRRQVDLIVSHMLDLGKKSQQIGAVLDIVSELAQQTNIVAINATIEAAGAGDAGKRFAVVADEIRKLAERVTESTKEIRGLIEDVRASVNTTVMATESGSKAVDAGSRQFGEVAAAFKQILGLVTTTTEAAREIELSTKQQMTAVEQVNTAIADVAQATRETEASSGQTLLTASQLAGLSQDLSRLVRPASA